MKLLTAVGVATGNVTVAVLGWATGYTSKHPGEVLEYANVICRTGAHALACVPFEAWLAGGLAVWYTVWGVVFRRSWLDLADDRLPLYGIVWLLSPAVIPLGLLAAGADWLVAPRPQRLRVTHESVRAICPGCGSRALALSIDVTRCEACGASWRPT